MSTPVDPALTQAKNPLGGGGSSPPGNPGIGTRPAALLVVEV